MVALTKNIFTSFMSLLLRSNGSAHVRLSERANNIFKNQSTGDKIIKAISEHKKDMSEGKPIVVQTPDDEEYSSISVERVSETSIDK